MRIPFMPPARKSHLSKRKGGGGRRKHYGFGSGSSSGISGSGPSISSPSISSGKPSTISSPNLSGGRTSATAYGSGGGSPFTIPSGQLFSGRSVGGGTRAQVYGTSAYGSGYPGIASSSRGVAGRGFPFFFWPVVWGGVGGSSHSYLHDTHEYGLPTNTSRPGNALAQASFISSTTNTTFHIIADNSTVTSLLSSIGSSCASSDLGQLSIAPTPYTGVSTDPQPEQAIQYYRASSVVLTLDGYNNTALADDTTSPPTPLPSGIDMTLLGCLNSTIGAAVPLVDASTTSSSLTSDALWTARWPPAGTIALVWLIIGVLQRL